MILTLEEAKRHLRVDDSFTDDDTYIEGLIGVAEADIANRLKYDTLSERFPDGDYPSPVIHAAKLIVAHYYENREPVAFASSSKVPMMIDSLLFPYVRYYEGDKKGQTEDDSEIIGDGPIRLKVPTEKSLGLG